MKTKSKLLFWGLIIFLIFSVCPLIPGMQKEALAADTSEITIQVENKALYEYLRDNCFQAESWVNRNALVSKDDENQKITLNVENVKVIKIIMLEKMKEGNFSDILQKLIRNCDNLEEVHLKDCNLSSFDFAPLNGKKKLSKLYLVGTNLTEVPNIKLGKLETLCLSENNLSANDACDTITGINFPNLKILYMDRCCLRDISFIKNTGGGLMQLSLADNGLTDDFLPSLLEMSKGALADLQELNLGLKIHLVDSTLYSNNSNNLKDMEKLALIPKCFPTLKILDLSALQITSLQAFSGLRDGIHIDFTRNKISDFAGLENRNIILGKQTLFFSGNFAPDWECEAPEILKNILDQNHGLHGSLENFTHCRLSDDGTKIFFEPKKTRASVKIIGGKLSDSTIYFEPIRQVPPYTVPQGLTATEGDTLAKVPLPEGFAWKDSFLGVGTAGTHTFKAVYTPENTAQYITIEIDVPVTVKRAVTVPKDPEVTPPVPEQPSEVKPDPEPEPVQDESNLTGNQIEDRKDLSLLLATGKQKGKNGIELTWKKKNGSSGYEVYWSYCDGKRNFKKAKTVKSTGKRTYIHKNLKKNRAYKYYIATYEMKNGKKVYQSKSPTIHVAMKQEKNTNVKSISVNKTKVSLKAKKTFQIKATAKAENKKKKLLAHADKFRYYTNDKKVATVTKKGKIQAKKKGSCSIFVIANNGVSKEIKVTVQ